MEEINIKADNVIKYFGEVIALNRISFEIAGKRIAILGHNGSGKTTIISILLGLLKPDGGNIAINGVKPYKNPKWVENNTSFCFEKGKFPFHIKVSTFIEELRGIRENKSLVDDLVRELNINRFRNDFMNELSSGQEQILYVLSAIASQSDILFLDEPFSHLDIFVRSKIYNYLRTSNRRFIIATQSIDEAELLCDTYVILNNGNLIWQGYMADLFDEKTFEVIPISDFSDNGLNAICSVENRYICEGTAEEFSQLVKDHKIMGFKRAGLRKIYGKIK